MFTGIVREVGRVLSIGDQGDTRIRIACARPAEEIDIGASIACSGVCLTVVARGQEGEQSWFDVDASTETRTRTTVGLWREGTKVNLEPALKVGDELGGHIVSGHVDAIGEITSIRPEGASRRLTVTAPRELGRFIAPKGSITVDGISLTVNEVEDAADSTRFGVNIIPHSWEATNLSEAVEGTRVNLEIDTLARYVARLAEAG
ncbi:MAG TPA: riboflavin synthase [Paracoccaceae bacterium]|nr:riboflavin synthase [Paracoccaceae bacterium]